MSPSSLRAVEAAHGALAWASIAATAAAAGLWLRVGRSPHGAPAALRKLAPLASALATGLIAAAVALGLALHQRYQRSLRQRIFIQSPRIGWLFERKEHVAFGAAMLAVAALAALAALELRERRRAGAPPDAITTALHNTVVRAYAALALLAAAAAVAAAVVARRYPFP